MENINLENNTVENSDNGFQYDIKLEKMRYQKNSLSYNLGMLGIGLLLFAAFLELNSTRPQFATLFFVLFTILVLLLGFMCCEKTRAYDKKYAFVFMVLGGLTALTIFWIPLQLIVNYASYTSCANQIAGLDPVADLDTINALKATQLANKQYLGDIVIGTEVAYWANNGIFRGILAMIFTIGSAVSFIFSGIICLKKSTALTNYLNAKKTVSNE